MENKFMIANVLEYLEESALRFPDRVVFSDELHSITYADLLDKAKRIGSGIIAATNQSQRKPVVVYVDRNIESLITFMGIAYSGNFYVPIDKQMPKMRIELILETLQPEAAIVIESDKDFSNSVASDLLTMIFEEMILSPINREKLDLVRTQTIDTDPLYATFTSGSTGIPKGVITCQRSVIDMTEALAYTFKFPVNSIFGNQNPYYFDASIKDIYSTLRCGGTMHVIPKSYFVFPAKLVGYIQENKIDTILWSAAAIALVANTNAFEEEKPNSLKNVMFSGEVMHNKVLNYWRRALPNTTFVNLYGPTEITSVCTNYIVEKEYGDNEPLPIGRPFRNTQILLLNDQNELVKDDEIGEICVRGCCLSMGYYNNPEKTSEAFCQNPLNTSFPEIIYRTGDLAKYNSEGLIMFLSRKDNQVKHMGQRVELGEIELLINSLQEIEASICFYDHDKQKIVLIYQGLKADRKYIIDNIKTSLPKYMYPNIYIKMNDLPYNLNGKIDRTLLKKMYINNEISIVE